MRGGNYNIKCNNPMNTSKVAGGEVYLLEGEKKEMVGQWGRSLILLPAKKIPKYAG